LAAIDFVIYLQLMWSVVALMTGEVTNVLLTLALTGLFPAAIARIFAAPPRRRRTVRRMHHLPLRLPPRTDPSLQAGFEGAAPDRR
jgi:hypothetical protein